MASFTGLATGAGAAGGLETLLARMRAEEALHNQGRSIDIDEFNAQSGDQYRQGELGVQQAGEAEKAREWDQSAPTRAAEVANTESGTAHNTAETGILNERIPMLRGLRSVVEGQDGTQGSDTGSSGAPASGVGSLDNPAGRLRLSLGGISPSGVFERPSGEEEFLDAGAKSRGMTDRNDPRYTFAMRNEDLAKKPSTVIAQGNLDNSSERLALSKQTAGERKQLNDLRIKQAEQQLAQIPPLQRELALAEFRNRIQNDVSTNRSFMQWINGDPVPDPGAQITAIAADVQTKYGQAATNGAGDDLDAELARRRAARGAK